MLHDMDKPSKVEVGQRWRDTHGEYTVVEVVNNCQYSFQRPGESVRSHGLTSFVCSPFDADVFLGWAPGYGPYPSTTPTGNRAADWLRNVAKVLEEKAISYGDSVGNPIRVFSHAGKTEGIKVRIDDKLSRVARGKEWPGDDVIVDLVGYLALLAVTEEEK